MGEGMPPPRVLVELLVYTSGPALPILTCVAGALFGDQGLWKGRAVGTKTEHRVGNQRCVKAALDKLAHAFDGSLNAVHLQGRFLPPDTHPVVGTANIDIQLSPRAADWATINADDPEFWRLKRNLRRELLSLESFQGYVAHCKIDRDPSYMRIIAEPVAETVTAELLRTMARPIAKQLGMEEVDGFVGYIDTAETTGDPRVRLSGADKSTRMDGFFDAAHRVTMGAAPVLEQYAKDVCAAFPSAPQTLEIFDGTGVHSFETWESVWKVFLPAWHDGKVR